MKEERTVPVEGRTYRVLLSDERKAVLEAEAAGGIVVGVLGGEETGARYLVTDPDAADERYLERVVRRKLGLPWIIARSRRLLIREFAADDARLLAAEERITRDDEMFASASWLSEYIRLQYGFYEYGIWAVTDVSDGRLVGKAGVVNAGADLERMLADTPFHAAQARDGAEPPLDLELGYHIFPRYREKGYGTEACRAVLSAVREEHPGERIRILARTDAANRASSALLQKCGFHAALNTDGQLLYVLELSSAERVREDGTGKGR